MVKLKSKGRKFTQFYASFNRIGAKRAGMEKSVWGILCKKIKVVAKIYIRMIKQTVGCLPRMNPHVQKTWNIDFKG